MLRPHQFEVEKHTDPDGTRWSRAESADGHIVIIATRPVVGCLRVQVQVIESTKTFSHTCFLEGTSALKWLNKYTDGGYGQGRRTLNSLYFKHFAQCA